MKFKLDENFGRRTQNLFRESGHDIQTVIDENLQGSSDRKLLKKCLAEGRILVTLDLDFADVIRFPPHKTCGLVVLRLPGRITLKVLELLIVNLLNMLETETVERQLWIVEPGRIRIHKTGKE
jgi:predicted nuclease of predicted toxin-antitoxin system